MKLKMVMRPPTDEDVEVGKSYIVRIEGSHVGEVNDWLLYRTRDYNGKGQWWVDYFDNYLSEVSPDCEDGIIGFCPEPIEVMHE